ncbi:Nramp family divalent metal transporter [Allomuricauda sp. d1]|uniref:Nramp family divalent metal transporter n=1 Tax=Allomuricauda sp. d1 TaxID=3136725 RepID=UPI0031DA4295
MFKKLGPGVLVAAAFIGPGTVTVCTFAGAGFGYALLWALLLSILATMALQEMAARLGLVTKKGLAGTIQQQIKNPLLKKTILIIILVAILIGNAAYEAGNIGGGTLGLEALFGTRLSLSYPFIIGSLAFLLLYIGNYKFLEKVFITLVIVMSLSFLLAAILVSPVLSELLMGLFVPQIPEGSLLTIVALVGTTIVPYNLFLHASLVNEKWQSVNDMQYVRWDTVVSIGLGGLVSMAIIVAAAAIDGNQLNNALDLAKTLEPVYGAAARYFLGIGLFAAGVTSAITAPLAAAYVASSVFGWKNDLKDWRFRTIWMVILFIGVISLFFEIRPIEIIRFAQVANGLLLPVVAVFLVWICNKRSVLGDFANTSTQKLLGYAIVGLAFFLGASGILKVFGII